MFSRYREESHTGAFEQDGAPEVRAAAKRRIIDGLVEKTRLVSICHPYHNHQYSTSSHVSL
jgi:hypothetical protein